MSRLLLQVILFPVNLSRVDRSAASTAPPRVREEEGRCGHSKSNGEESRQEYSDPCVREPVRVQTVVDNQCEDWADAHGWKAWTSTQSVVFLLFLGSTHHAA